jgi:predicted ATPase
MPAELHDITIKGFKSIASIEKLRLNQMNVLIGANGSGKSNFIGVFSFLHAIREGGLQNYVRQAGGAEQLLHFGSKITKQIEIDLSFLDEVNQYELTLKPTADDSLYPAYEWVGYWDKSAGYQSPLEQPLEPQANRLEAGISRPGLQRIPGWVQHRLGLWRIYHVHDTSSTSPMRKTAQLDDNIFLRPDGSNLPAFLYLMQQKHEKAYQLVRHTVQRAAPFFDDFVLRPDPLNDRTIRLAWRHKNSEQYFGVGALSDGTLRFVLLTTLFLQPLALRPPIIIVDEPELGLHPYAITLLASLAKQAAATTQVILSTQSSILLDHFEPNDVLVAERKEGATQLIRLENSSQLENWLENYSLGQLWEKNEIGGRPSSE